jgi:dihydrolipoamide dehydrogenase
MLEFKLPIVGENIEKGTVVKIHVAVGDSVKKDQTLFDLETDKASLEVPSPAAGVIKEILIKEGQDVKIGQVVMRIEKSSGAETLKKETTAPTASVNKKETPAPAQQQKTTQPIPTPAPSTPRVTYDTRLVVVGGGPGGYAAAFLAADLGLNVTLIDLDVNPGGVCLYRGCIPSKALLHAAKVLSESREAKDFGIEFAKPKIDLNKLRAWKNQVVQQLTGGVGQLCKLRKVKYIQGYATFTDSHTLQIKKVDGSQQKLTFETAIIATGSRPIALPFAPKSPRILDSTTALEIESIPKTMLIVGGGYIGLELGTVYAALGSEIDVVEMLPQIMTGADRDIAAIVEKRLKIIFKNIAVSTKVTQMEETKTGIKVSFEDKDGKASLKEYEKVLVSIGRKPNSDNIGLDKTRVTVTKQGFVEVNAQRQTSDPSIYAIGDIAGQPMLAHKASHEGRVAVEAIAGHKVAFEPQAIPAVVFTDPEIAWAGLTETEAKAQGRAVEVAKFPWAASGRAITLNRTDGLTKLIIDPQTERILGVSIVGPGAGELIAEGVLAIEMGAVAADLKLTIHPHPTLTETVMESAEAFFGQSTHVYRPKHK